MIPAHRRGIWTVSTLLGIAAELPPPAKPCWVCVGSCGCRNGQCLAWSLPWLSLSKRGVVYALGMFRGRAAESLLHPLRVCQGVVSSVPSQGTPVPVAESQGQTDLAEHRAPLWEHL